MNIVSRCANFGAVVAILMGWIHSGLDEPSNTLDIIFQHICKTFGRLVMNGDWDALFSHCVSIPAPFVWNLVRCVNTY